MPDENFASSEHELIQELTAPFSAIKEDPGADPGEPDFPVVLRGYDRLAVDAYISQTRQLISELRSTSSPEAAVRRALEQVGEQVSGILQRAHETADKITAHSRSEAEGRLMTARREVDEIKTEAEQELQNARRDAVDIRGRAEQQLTELDADTDRIWAERHRIVEDARELARQLLALAESAAERFPPAEEPAAEEPADTEPTGDPTPAEPERDREVPPPVGATGPQQGPEAPEDDTESTIILPPRPD